MTTITDKKQYPGEQYLNELITNIEFAARAPVEVVRAMAAELQKRREADSAEPASNHEELPLDYLQGQKDGLEWAAQLAEANHPQTGDWLYDDPLELAKAIRKGPDMPEFDGPTPITPEAIENAIEYIRSIAFHIDEDDYHGKHIAYFMRQALVWLEGHSCSDDRQGKAENQPVRGNQAAESNRGNEWTGNPDIDNAIIMLDRIDTLESCDDDRIEAVKTVLRRLAGNYPVTPDGWISCSERMPPQDDWILIYSKHGEYMAGQVQGEYVELSDGTLSWLGRLVLDAATRTAAGGEVMDSFAKYTIIDWIAFIQVLLIWFYMAYRSGQWIVSVACSNGWRWWNRKNKKALALASFYEAFNLNSLQPGSVVVVTTQSGMTIQIHKPKEEGRG